MKTVRHLLLGSLIAAGCQADDRAVPPSPPSTPVQQAQQRAADDYDYKSASMNTCEGLSTWISRIDREGDQLQVEYNVRAEEGCKLWLSLSAWCVIEFRDSDGAPIGKLQGQHIVLGSPVHNRPSGMQRTIRVTPPKGAIALRAELAGYYEITTKPCRLPPPKQLLH